MYEVNFGNEHLNNDWGCAFIEVTSNNKTPKIRVCHVNVAEIAKLAAALSSSVLDSSWIMQMDQGAQKSYQYTVAETAQRLVEVFSEVRDQENSLVSGEFGELMVSMGASNALETVFQHTALPIAELWKPQKKQNEGFDFHTVCTQEIINFGEAKFKSPPANSPASESAKQANRFFNEEKHYRDRVHLVNLVSQNCIAKLDQGMFGMVVSFSMNAKNPLTVYKNVLNSIEALPIFKALEAVYIVGVSHGG